MVHIRAQNDFFFHFKDLFLLFRKWAISWNVYLRAFFVCKGKVNISCYRPGQALGVPAGWDSRISRQSEHTGGKVVSHTHRPSLPTGRIPGTQLCQRLSRPQGHNTTGRIKSLKNSSDYIGNGTRDLLACSAVPQPTAPPRTPVLCTYIMQPIDNRSNHFLGYDAAWIVIGLRRFEKTQSSHPQG